MLLRLRQGQMQGFLGLKVGRGGGSCSIHVKLCVLATYSARN